MAIQEKIKMTLEVSPQLYATIDSLAQKIGGDKADVLLKAKPCGGFRIALLEFAVEAKEQGMEMAIVPLDETNLNS